jgi:hypothetical protein
VRAAAARGDFSKTLGGQYYPAYGSPLVVTPADVLVWGSRPGLVDLSNATAYLYSVSRADGSLHGPELRLANFGDGESAEALAASDDGTLILASAGHKLVVLERGSASSHNYTTRFALEDSDNVFSDVAFANDGSLIAFACTTGVCVRKYDAGKKTYAPLWSAKAAVADLVPDVLVFSQVSGASAQRPILVVSLDDAQDAKHWAVAAYDALSGKLLWTYKSKTSSGEVTDFVRSIAVTRDGAYVAVGSFGDAQRINPQVHVFRGTGGGANPLVGTFATSGSVGSVVIDYAGGSAGTSELIVGVASLSHHENISLKGGVAWLLRVSV